MKFIHFTLKILYICYFYYLIRPHTVVSGKVLPSSMTIWLPVGVAGFVTFLGRRKSLSRLQWVCQAFRGTPTAMSWMALWVVWVGSMAISTIGVRISQCEQFTRNRGGLRQALKPTSAALWRKLCFSATISPVTDEARWRATTLFQLYTGWPWRLFHNDIHVNGSQHHFRESHFFKWSQAWLQRCNKPPRRRLCLLGCFFHA